MSTIRDVAREAGVSEGTVSNVFNERPYVTETTREKVLDAARRVGYHRNSLAQALRLGKRNVFGLCLRDIGNPTFSSIVLGIETVARQRNYQVLLGNSAGNPDTERGYLETFLSHQVAGIVTAPVLDDPSYYRSIAESGVPIVFVNERPHGVPGDLVKHDYAGGTRLATEHLLRLGHTRIAIVYGPAFAAPGIEQQSAFRSTLKAAGLEVDEGIEAFATFGIEGAEEAARELLSAERPPSALIGSTLAITLGCLRAIAKTGAQIEFVGTGDESWLQIFPELTMVHQRPEAVGRTAVSRLLGRIDQDSDALDTKDIVLPVELITPQARSQA